MLSVFAEFFAATEADVQSTQAQIIQDGVSNLFSILDFDSPQADELNELVLSQLYAILTGRDPDSDAVLDELIDEHRAGFRDGSLDNGVWLIRVPARLAAELLSKSSSEREAAAEMWARASEFSYPGTALEDVSELLEELTAVARRAAETGQSLYARMSFT